jgi:plasmid stabilization system protein ParE
MTFQVVVETQARAEIEAAYRWLAERAPLNAVRWYNRLMNALETLREQPCRCALARESRHFTEPIRQLLFGRATRRYRVLFVVRGTTVHVLHFRHWARAAMRRTSIRWPERE